MPPFAMRSAKQLRGRLPKVADLVLHRLRTAVHVFALSMQPVSGCACAAQDAWLAGGGTVHASPPHKGADFIAPGMLLAFKI